MPRDTRRTRPGTIIIPKDMNQASWKVIWTDSAGVEHDITNFMVRATLNFNATVGVNNFSVDIDNAQGRYMNDDATIQFTERDSIDFYYDFTAKASLSTIRLRGYIDAIFHSFNLSDAFMLHLEGRGVPRSSTYDHFADTFVSLQFVGMNNLDCFAGTTGSQDSFGNREDGILYNSGMVLKVYDTLNAIWKDYASLSDSNKNSIKSQTGYTQTHTQTYVDQSRLSIGKAVALQGDYDFRIEYDSSSGNTFFRLFPEESLTNKVEYAAAGKNLISIGRYGNDTTEEYNRIKEIGVTDGNILIFRTKENTSRQQVIWIKDKVETTNALTKNEDIVAKAVARLDELDESINKGNLQCCMLPTLKPGDRIKLTLPHILDVYVKVKSFSVIIDNDVIFNLSLKERETSFESIFKDRINETSNLAIPDNPNGMTNAIVYDFSDEDDYEIVHCYIVGGVLYLNPTYESGTCTIDIFEADDDVTQCELRVSSIDHQLCSYEVSNNGGVTWEDYTLGTVHTFSTVGSELRVRINLADATLMPKFNKINLLYK